jgi:hypothetical protein
MAFNIYIKIIKNLQSGCKLCGLAQSRETLRSGDFAQRFFFSVAAIVFDLVGSKSGDFAQRRDFAQLVVWLE